METLRSELELVMNETVTEKAKKTDALMEGVKERL